MTGIRINELRLAGAAGSDKTYGTGFRPEGASGGHRPLSIIAGPSQTGKTTIIDFVRYCLGATTHPQHEEVIRAVRAALLETELDGVETVIERSATGEPSSFASVWRSTLAETTRASEERVTIEPTSDPEGLSQLLLAACNLDGVLLPDSSVKDETATQTLSIRDLFNIIFVPNERLDNKSLVFEQANFMVRQKHRQIIDAMFGIHDNTEAVLASRYKTAREKARAAEVRARTLRQFAESEHPRGPMQLQMDLDKATADSVALHVELATLDAQQRSTQEASAHLRSALEEAEQQAKAARVRVRDRRSLISRMDALRGQYADDQRKLNFLLDAERLFDPLHIVTCPACFNDLAESPKVVEGECSLCHSTVGGSASASTEAVTEEPLADPADDAVKDVTGSVDGARNAVIGAELRAVRNRLRSLNEYVTRLTTHQRVLIEDSVVADEAADAAARAVDAIVDSPAPWLALRDGINQRTIAARLTQQSAQAGVNAWERVAEAEKQAKDLDQAAKDIHAQRRQERQRPDRTRLISDMSTRFGEILSAIEYPKLHRPYLGDDLVPYVRGLPYTDASSGGMVVIGLAWNLALWELAHERDADAPGLLVIDSPQKNLGHNHKPGDTDFADARLVQNFYAHVKNWLATDGAGAQLIVVDNSPPPSVDDDVVVRFTRDPDDPPYGLIPEATN